jgi:hypothetical protein
MQIPGRTFPALWRGLAARRYGRNASLQGWVQPPPATVLAHLDPTSRQKQPHVQFSRVPRQRRRSISITPTPRTAGSDSAILGGNKV